VRFTSADCLEKEERHLIYCCLIIPNITELYNAEEHYTARNLLNRDAIQIASLLSIFTLCQSQEENERARRVKLSPYGLFAVVAFSF